jgi:hypothetical protein
MELELVQAAEQLKTPNIFAVFDLPSAVEVR